MEFEFVVEMNLVQIATNEFFPQLIRLAAKRKAPTVPARTAARNRGDAIKVQWLLNSSCPSRGDPFPTGTRDGGRRSVLEMRHRTSYPGHATGSGSLSEIPTPPWLHFVLAVGAPPFEICAG